MFRTLRTVFERKKKDIEQQAHIHQKVQDIISQYGGSIQVSYDIHEGVLKIQTQSKTLASELLLRSHEIGALLRREGIALKQLIIR